MNIPRLFDRAKRHTGSDGMTARTLGVNPNRVSEWRNGHRPCPAEVQDKLCVIAELSDGEIARHVIQRAGLVRRPNATRARMSEEFA
jgi:DNA-binding transcriptional regulator YdaS (Cro superfamily)